MPYLQQAGFQGFSPATLSFLSDLKANNNKAWFEEHRTDYQMHLLEPPPLYHYLARVTGSHAAG
ncbi:MAG TPA: DUF2461 family protein [Spirochaetia bacterium]|nr:DUF2461 family protein [Spirochaetia bacterium]